MAGVFLDAVLNGRMDVLYNGTPEDTVRWLKNLTAPRDWTVVPGHSMTPVSVEAYLQAAKERDEMVKQERIEKIQETVMVALEDQRVAIANEYTYSPQMLAKTAALEIVKLFD